MFDWIIRDGKIIDGTGTDPETGDIGGDGDRIKAIGNLRDQPARFVIDATGCFVCPGFIDAHSHSDVFLLAAPEAPSKVYQGITTEIIGNCGASAAPIKNKPDLPFDWNLLKCPGEWRNMSEYLRLLEQCRPAVNIVPLAGHNKIRSFVMGYENRSATADELRQMKRLLEESMDAGAWGLSTGLIYRPGKYAESAEIKALAEIVARRNGIYTTHMRNEGLRLLDGIAEALDVARETGVRLEIAHLKTAVPESWDTIDDALAMIEKAQADGIEVAADRYLYIRSGTSLDILLPDWLSANDNDNILKDIRTETTRKKLLKELSDKHPSSYWDTVFVATSSEPGWRGRSIRAIAEDMDVEPPEAVIRIFDRDSLRTQAFFEGMNESNMWKILARPYVMICTDTSLRTPSGLFENDHPHPRAYGSFTRFLRSALDGKTVPLPEAIRKMTSLPAGHFRIKDRGTLKAGNMADIVVFEPDSVRDHSTYEQPHQLSTGIRAMMVNGKPVIADNRQTDNRPGKILAPA